MTNSYLGASLVLIILVSFATSLFCMTTLGIWKEKNYSYHDSDTSFLRFSDHLRSLREADAFPTIYACICGTIFLGLLSEFFVIVSFGVPREELKHAVYLINWMVGWNTIALISIFLYCLYQEKGKPLREEWKEKWEEYILVLRAKRICKKRKLPLIEVEQLQREIEVYKTNSAVIKTFARERRELEKCLCKTQGLLVRAQSAENILKLFSPEAIDSLRKKMDDLNEQRSSNEEDTKINRGLRAESKKKIEEAILRSKALKDVDGLLKDIKKALES